MVIQLYFTAGSTSFLQRSASLPGPSNPASVNAGDAGYRTNSFTSVPGYWAAGLYIVSAAVPGGTKTVAGTPLTLSAAATLTGYFDAEVGDLIGGAVPAVSATANLQPAVTFQAAAVVDISATGILRGVVFIQSAAVVDVSGSAKLTAFVPLGAIAAVPGIAATGRLQLSTDLVAIVAPAISATAKLTADFGLAGAGVPSVGSAAGLSMAVRLTAAAVLSVAAAARLGFRGLALTVTDAVDDILLVWGVEGGAALASPAMQTHALRLLNNSVQTIWTTAKERDYFTRAQITLSFNSGDTTAALPEDVQGVVGPIRNNANQRPLLLLESRGQFDQFAPLFLGTGSATPGTPLACFVQRSNVNGADNAGVALLIVPAPAATFTAALEVTIEPPRYEWTDYV